MRIAFDWFCLLLPLGCARPGATSPPPSDVAARDLPTPLHDKVHESCGSDEYVGTKLKPFALQTVDGEPVTERSWSGRVLLVNFWATWCKPCRQELPEFEQIYRRYEPHGLTLVKIAGDEDPELVKEYATSEELSAPIVMGMPGVTRIYGSTKYPISLVVDGDGVIRASFYGYKPRCMGTLEAEIRTALGAGDQAHATAIERAPR